MSAQDHFSRKQFSQTTLLKTDRKYNPATGEQDHVLGKYIPEEGAVHGAYNHWSGYDNGEPMAYSTRNDSRPARSPDVGSSSSRTAQQHNVPAAPAGKQKQKTGYGEGPGFPRNSQNGYQQGHLFANEAPARDQNVRQHIGHTPDPEAVRESGAVPNGKGGYRGFMKPVAHGTPVNDQGRPLTNYDTRKAKGSITGTGFDPNEPLYHGTKKELKGDQIVPGKYKASDQIGHKKGMVKGGRRTNAYATPDPDLAKGFTQTAKGKPGATAKAYEVKATGPVSADLEYLSPVSPLEREDTINKGASRLPAVKSPKPFKVMNEVQF